MTKLAISSLLSKLRAAHLAQDLEGARSLLRAVEPEVLAGLAHLRDPSDLDRVLCAVELSTPLGQILFERAMRETPILLEPLLKNPTLSAVQWKTALGKFLTEHPDPTKPISYFGYLRSHIRGLALSRPELFNSLPDDFSADSLLVLLDIAEPLLKHRIFLGEVARRLSFEDLTRCFEFNGDLRDSWPWEISGTQMAERFIKKEMAWFRSQEFMAETLLELFEANKSLCQMVTKPTLASLMATGQTQEARQAWFKVLAWHLEGADARRGAPLTP